MVGLSAALLTSSGFIPQIIKGFRTKRLSDVSTAMLCIWIVGTSLWFAYGWHLGDLIIMGANVFTCSCGVLILLMKIRLREIKFNVKIRLPVNKRET